MCSPEVYENFNANINNRFKRTWAKYTGDNLLPEIEPYISVANSYYQNNLQRGEHFIQNCQVLTDNPQKIPDIPGYDDDYWDYAANTLEGAKEIYVFITGGFHSKYLSKEFRRSNNSYITIIPNVTKPASLPDSYRILRNKICQG